MTEQIPDSHYLQSLHRPADIAHLRDRNILLTGIYDNETNGLSKKYTFVTEFAAVLVDILNRITTSIDIKFLVPEQFVGAPQAYIITQSFPSDIHYGADRDPPHIAAGRMAEFFQKLYPRLWDSIGEDEAIIIVGNPEKEDVRLYHHDDVTYRLHEPGKTMSRPFESDLRHVDDFKNIYRDEDGSLWRKEKTSGISPLPWYELWEQQAGEKQTITRSRLKSEVVRIFEVPREDGGIEIFRLHNGGKSLSSRMKLEQTPDGARTYRDLDGTRWKRVFPGAITTGFNNIQADDPWIMMSAFMAGAADIVIPYLKENHLFRMDVRTITQAVVAFNNKGTSGVRPGQAISPQTNKSYQSFGLNPLMKANTWLGDAEKGVEEGIRMPDGSVPEERLAHASPLYDVLQTTSLLAYDRWHAPEIVRQMEQNTDLEKLKNFLTGEEGFERHPLRAFMRKDYSHLPHIHVCVCINVNEEIKERPQAVLMRTDTDVPLKDYTYKGAHLVDMDVDQLAIMLDEQKGTQDALCEIIDLRKCPPVFDAKLAFDRGCASNIDAHQANQRFIVENADLVNRLMQAHAKALVPFAGADDSINPRIEEEIFTNFRELKRYAITLPDGTTTLVPEDVHTFATAKLQQGRDIDYALRKLLGPNPVEWFDKIPPGKRKELIEEFADKIKKIESDLEKYQTVNCDDPLILPEPGASYKIPEERDEEGPMDPSPETIDECCRNAIEYLWKLRSTFMYSFNDHSLHYRVLDDHGHEIPFTDLLKMPEHIRGNKLANSEYTIKFEPLNYSSEKIARMFLTTPGRLEFGKNQLRKKIDASDNSSTDVSVDILLQELREWEEWEEYDKALAALHLHGPPHVDADEHEWMSAAKALKEVERIRRNFKRGSDIRADEDELGLWRIFINNREKAEAILDACEKHCRTMLEKYSFTPERKKMMGYDEKGWPFEHIKYRIPANAWVMMLDVADHVLSEPLSHIEIGSYLVPITAPADLNLVQEMAEKRPFVLLRGQESGKIYLAAGAVIVHDITPQAQYDDLYDLARKRFIDSGAEFPKDKNEIVWLKTERKPEEVPVALKAASEEVQAIKLNRLGTFDGTISTILSHRPETITGFLIKDEGFTPQPGKARLREIVPASKQNGVAANDNFKESGWEREIDIESVQTYTLEEFKDIIARSIKLHNAAVKSGLPDIEALKKRVANDQTAIIEGFKNRAQLEQELASGILTQADAIRCGYSSLDDMRSQARRLFTNHDRKEDAEDSRIILGLFDRASKDATTHHNPGARPLVGFERPPDNDTRKKILSSAGRVFRL